MNLFFKFLLKLLCFIKDIFLLNKISIKHNIFFINILEFKPKNSYSYNEAKK